MGRINEKLESKNEVLWTNTAYKSMAHSTVWGHSPIQRQNTILKNLMIKTLSKSGLRRCGKFGQVNSNDE